MKEKPVYGKSRITLILTLIIGALVVLVVTIVTRQEDPSAQTSVSGSKADRGILANVPRPLTMKYRDIRKWIQDEMASRGARLSVVNIWATWCAPCRAEMPELAKFAASGTAPLFLVSADNESDIDEVQAFLAENKAHLQTSLIAGAQDEFIAEWQKLTTSLKTPWSMTLPATFLVTDTGEVRAMLARETTAEELKNLVSKHRDARR